MKTTKNSISMEEMVADTLLQNGQTITLGGREYEIAPPTVATLAMASREISRIPKTDTILDNDVIFKALSFAKHGEIIVRVIAILIVGAKALRDEKNGQRKGIFGKSFRNRLDEVTEQLMYEAQPIELASALATILGMMQVSDFFALTASLSKVNILAPTIKTAETTVSGR